jgi:hypothetical protein
MTINRFERLIGENLDPHYGFKVGDSVKIPAFEKLKAKFPENNLNDLDNLRENYVIVSIVDNEKDEEPYAIVTRNFNESMTEEGAVTLQSGNVGKMETRKMKLKYLARLMETQK